MVAVLLVVLNRRFLGGRELTDYGRVIDRRWIIDLTAGLVVGLLWLSHSRGSLSIDLAALHLVDEPVVTEWATSRAR